MRFSYVCVLLLAVTTPSVALNNKEVVHFMQDFLNHLPPLVLPEVDVSKIDLFAKAIDITVSDLGLSDLSLSIPDEGHMLFTFSGMTGQLGMHLTAGITTPHIERSWNLTGKMSDLDVKVTFGVANGNAVMSHVDLNCGGLTVNFGDDKLANILAKVFLPVLRAAVNKFLPIAIMAFKNGLDFQHLINFMLKSFSAVPLPNATLSMKGYSVELMDIAIDEPSSDRQTFRIADQTSLVFDMEGLVGTGSMTFKYGRDGNMSTAVGKIGLFNTTINVATSVVQNSDGSFNLDYLSAAQDIGKLTLVSSSSDPLVQFLVSSVQSFLKSFIEDGFSFLFRAFLSL